MIEFIKRAPKLHCVFIEFFLAFNTFFVDCYEKSLLGVGNVKREQEGGDKYIS